MSNKVTDNMSAKAIDITGDGASNIMDDKAPNSNNDRTANILYGKVVSEGIEKEISIKIAKLNSQNITPTLAILRIGENPADIAYENAVIKRASKLGINTKQFALALDVSQAEVLDCIDQINNDDKLHGALIFRPLPKGLDDNILRNRLAVSKDLDAITDEALAYVFTGNAENYPCTAMACVELLKNYKIPLSGKVVLVIGRSLVIGKPVSMLMQRENATVIMTHSKTTSEQLKKLSAVSDIVIVATGKADTFGREYAQAGQIIIDVGMNRTGDGRLVGDVSFDEVANVVEAITPVPKGVGNITTACLLKQLVEAAEKSTK